MRTMLNLMGLAGCLMLLPACQPAQDTPASGNAQDMADGTAHSPAAAPAAAGEMAALAYAASTCEQARPSVLRVTDVTGMLPMQEIDSRGGLSCMWLDTGSGHSLNLSLEKQPGLASLPVVAPASATPAPLFEQHGGSAITVVHTDASTTSRTVIHVAPGIQLSIIHSVPARDAAALMSTDLAYQVALDLLQQ